MPTHIYTSDEPFRSCLYLIAQKEPHRSAAALVPSLVEKVGEFLLERAEQKRAWINARSDTLFESTAFRESAAKRRCLVPATGWYEWQDTGAKRKQPYYLHFDRVFAFAGVWTARKVNDSDWEANFAIITTDARGIAGQIHDRMPLVMHPRNYALWIDPAAENPVDLLSPFDGRSHGSLSGLDASE